MIIASIGCFILGIGIGMCDLARLGTDPFTVLLVGMQAKIGLTLGIMNVIVCLMMIAFAWFVDKTMISAVSFLSMICTSAGIDVITLLFKTPPADRILAFLLLLAGVVVYAAGTGLAITPEAGYDSYDAFLIALQKLSGRSYKEVRWCVEIVFLAVGALLGGRIGIGTLVTFAATGPLVELLHRLFRRHLPVLAHTLKK